MLYKIEHSEKLWKKRRYRTNEKVAFRVLGLIIYLL